MYRVISVSGLMRTAGVNHKGKIIVNEQMSGLEPNPRDDWLYLGLLSIRDIAGNKKHNISSIANIGSGNGIETIAELKLFKNIKKITVTDIIPDILPQIKRNVEQNVPKEAAKVKIKYVHGRDCEPLNEKADFIYANLPLIMVNSSELRKNLATTTLTEANHYSHLSKDEHDVLKKYSLLSQLGFLLSAKKKLNMNGIIITLLGGRVPQSALTELFKRAGLKHKELYCAFKLQSDPQFLKQYAEYEKTENVQFDFYDYPKAAKILRERLKTKVPDIVQNCSGEELKKLIISTHLNAKEAYQMAKKGRKIGHLAFAFKVYR